MKLTMPYPPGANTLYGVRATIARESAFEILKSLLTGSLGLGDAYAKLLRKTTAFPYKTHEHRDYVTQARQAVLEAGLTAAQLPRWPKPATVAMRVDLYRPRRAGDIDGPLKCLLDVLQGLAFENDDQVARLEVHRHDDKHRPRVELEVSQLADQQPQQADLGFTPAPAPMSAAPRNHARPVSIPDESWATKVRRLATPAVVKNRNDDPEAQ